MAVGVIRGTSGKTGRCGRTDTYGDSMTYGLWKIISDLCVRADVALLGTEAVR